jgi:hypothetical protein
MKRKSRQRVKTEDIYNLFVLLEVIPLFDKYDETIRVLKKVAFICPKHEDKGVQYRTYDSIHNKKINSACKYCNIEEGIDARRYDIEYVKKCFDQKNAMLISDEYLSQSEKLFFICNKHKSVGVQTTCFSYVLSNKEICKICKYNDRKGDKHYNWQGGITNNIRGFENRTEEYKQWVQSVFIKDSFTCQCCGQHGGTLSAHHLYSFSKYKNIRTNVNNGITLCLNCHDSRITNSFHNLYGTQNTIPEDLYEYIQRYQSGEFN